MKYIKKIITIFLIVIFSATFLNDFSISSFLPNLILIIVLLYACQTDFKFGLISALLAGFLLDVIGFNFPYNIFLILGIVLLANFVLKRFFEGSSILTYAIFCLVGSAIYDLVNSIIFKLPMKSSVIMILGDAVYSMIVALTVGIIYQSFNKPKDSQILFVK